MGNGPYLGQKGKYEVILLLPSQAASTAFLEQEFGLLIKMTQRWNVIPRDTLILVAHTESRVSCATTLGMHNHVIFNLGDQPARRLTSTSPTRPRSGCARAWALRRARARPEVQHLRLLRGLGGGHDPQDRLGPEVRKLIAKGRALRMAELVALKDYAGLELEHHFTTWSMTDFLVEDQPEWLRLPQRPAARDHRPPRACHRRQQHERQAPRLPSRSASA